MAFSSDLFVLLVGVVAAALYLFRESIFTSNAAAKAAPVPSKSIASGSGNPRDFVAKMKEGVRVFIFFSAPHR